METNGQSPTRGEGLLTQLEVASLLGVTFQAVSKTEKNALRKIRRNGELRELWEQCSHQKTVWADEQIPRWKRSLVRWRAALAVVREEGLADEALELEKAIEEAEQALQRVTREPRQENESAEVEEGE